METTFEIWTGHWWDGPNSSSPMITGVRTATTFDEACEKLGYGYSFRDGHPRMFGTRLYPSRELADKSHQDSGCFRYSAGDGTYKTVADLLGLDPAITKS